MEPRTQQSSPPSTPTGRYQMEPDSTDRRMHEESLLDAALAATFPCSDPVSTLSVDDPDEQAGSSVPTKHW